MKVLVMGGTQFNGLALVHELVARGHDVTVCNRGRTESDIPDSVQRLVADGLADRYPSPDDGRIVMVKISESGRARHGVVDERRAEAMALILGRFTPDERSELADLLDRFVQAVDDSGDRLARSPMMSRSQPS